MKRHLTTTHLWLALGLLLITAACAPFSLAQTPTPAQQLYRVQVIKLNPGMTDEWRKFYQTEILPGLKKAGIRQHSVWNVAQGPVRQYFIITPLDSLAQLDEPGPLAKALGQDAARAINMKQSRFFAEWQTHLVVGRPDLGIAPTSNDTPKLAVLITTSVTPGRGTEWEKGIKENVLPVAKKTSVKGVLAGRVLLGGDPNEYHTLYLFDSYADMAKFQAEAAKATTELKLSLTPPAGIVAHNEWLVVRYVPELSIRPEPQKAESKE